MATIQQDGVTAVVTSCGRHDLLQQTLDSFFAFNTYPLERTIIVEDGPAISDMVRSRYTNRSMMWLSTGKRVGQIAAIDYAYSNVTTSWVFHLEDDWEFYREGFIEDSMKVLRAHRDCLQVWIRALDDVQRHPIDPQVKIDGGVAWREMARDYDLNSSGVLWHGFSFNPGLRRFADYVEIGGYGKHARYDFKVPWKAEHAINDIYRQRGFFAAILCDEMGKGYVRHLGRGRRVAPPPAESRPTQ
jgi:hypothetical protein